MAPPAEIVQWLRRTYPSPQIDNDWLDACCAWINDELNIDPISRKDEFIHNVETQLLESDLCDSTIAGTGLPNNVAAMNGERLRGQPVLVEIVAIDEVGHSAFNLQNTRQTRMEREDLAGLALQEGVEDDEGPIPNYPHTMLKFHISDGNVTLPAIEYRAIPQLKLSETPLGYKMLLKDVLIRRGIAFLEPGNVELKGHQTPDRDKSRDRDFVRGLCARLGKPPPPDEEEQNDNEGEGQENIGLGRLQADTAPAAQPAIRPPLRELSEPPEPQPDRMQLDDDAELPRKRRVPRSTGAPSVPSSSTAASSTLVASRFFPGSERPATPPTTATTTQSLARILSLVRGPPIDIDNDDEEENVPATNVAAGVSTRQTDQRPTQASRRLRADVSFEEFDFPSDDDLDAAFLDEVAKVEKAALGSGQEAESLIQPAAQAARLPADSSSVVSVSDTSSGVSSRVRQQAHARVTQTQGRTRTAPAAVPANVITIDDEDEDDKENMPVPQRRVRRRVVNSVIDLSD